MSTPPKAAPLASPSWIKEEQATHHHCEQRDSDHRRGADEWEEGERNDEYEHRENNDLLAAPFVCRIAADT